MEDPPEDDAARPEQPKNKVTPLRLPADVNDRQKEPTRLRFVTPEQSRNLTTGQLEALPDSECIIVSGEFEEALGPGEVACKEYGDSGAVEKAADDQLSKWLEANDPLYLPVSIAIDAVDRLFVPKARELSLVHSDPDAHLLALKRLVASVLRSLWRDPPPEIERWYSKPGHGDIRKADIRKAVEEHVGPVLDRLVREHQAYFVMELKDAERLLSSTPAGADNPGHEQAVERPPRERETPQEAWPPIDEQTEAAERGEIRSEWIAKMLEGRPLKFIMTHPDGISDNTLRRYRSGEKSNQDGAVRGQLAKVFACDFRAVPL